MMMPAVLLFPGDLHIARGGELIDRLEGSGAKRFPFAPDAQLDLQMRRPVSIEQKEARLEKRPTVRVMRV